MDYMDNYQLSDHLIITMRGGISVTSFKETGAPACHLIEHTRSVTECVVIWGPGWGGGGVPNSVFNKCRAYS